jgi:hypothetical protein
MRQPKIDLNTPFSVKTIAQTTGAIKAIKRKTYRPWIISESLIYNWVPNLLRMRGQELAFFLRLHFSDSQSLTSTTAGLVIFS